MTSCARIAAFTSKLYYCKKAALNCSKQSPPNFSYIKTKAPLKLFTEAPKNSFMLL